jgi:DNA (cytosine-5)-methyltransferase 1
MIKYSKIKNDLEIETSKENKNKDDELAFLTHYLQNSDSPIGSYYVKKAENYINQFDTSFNFSNNREEIEWDVTFPPPENPLFKFIDLFAGIGGFRIAFQKLGGKCVFSSEIDKYCKITYEENFGEVPFGDIKEIHEKDVPDHDILLAGFPCQTFSIAGKKAGFKDVRGTLFFDIARILKKKKPKAFLLENVKGLNHHDKGKTLATILNVLRKDLDYYVPQPEILNAKDFGVPQNRERIFIVGFRKDLNISTFNYPGPLNMKTSVKNILEDNPVSVKYYLSKRYLDTLKEHKMRHKNKGNGFGYKVISSDKCANAIVIGGMGKERNLIYDDRLTNFIPVTKIKGEVNRECIRRMTPREWARLQGYPEKFKIKVSDSQAYKQFGNSVAVPVVQEIGKAILNLVLEKK